MWEAARIPAASCLAICNNCGGGMPAKHTRWEADLVAHSASQILLVDTDGKCGTVECLWQNDGDRMMEQLPSHLREKGDWRLFPDLGQNRCRWAPQLLITGKRLAELRSFLREAPP